MNPAGPEFAGCLRKENLRLLSGHLTWTLKGHPHKLRIVEDEFCRFCGAKEATSTHLLLDSDVVTVSRARSFGRHQISLEVVPSLDPLPLGHGLLETYGVGILRLPGTIDRNTVTKNTQDQEQIMLDTPKELLCSYN